jgi:hypothetical protein
MKKQLFATFIFTILTVIAFAQSTSKDVITIILKNTSLLPKKCTLISYEPGDVGNGTRVIWFLPIGTKSLKFKVGTKLYDAKNAQVGTVMSGKRIDNDVPFLVVKQEDDNQTFKL